MEAVKSTTWVSGRKRYSEVARKLQEEILTTGTITVGREQIRVNDVTVFRERGVISGWDIVIDGDPETYNAYISSEREDKTYVRILMKKPGLVVAVGYHLGGGTSVSIVYKDE